MIKVQGKFIYLMCYWYIFTFALVILSKLGLAVFNFSQNESEFVFNWEDNFFYAVKFSVVGLGFGTFFWFKAKFNVA